MPLFLCSSQTHAGKQRPLNGERRIRNGAKDDKQSRRAFGRPGIERGHECVRAETGHGWSRGRRNGQGDRQKATTGNIDAVRLPVRRRAPSAPDSRPFGGSSRKTVKSGAVTEPAAEATKASPLLDDARRIPAGSHRRRCEADQTSSGRGRANSSGTGARGSGKSSAQDQGKLRENRRGGSCQRPSARSKVQPVALSPGVTTDPDSKPSSCTGGAA